MMTNKNENFGFVATIKSNISPTKFQIQSIKKILESKHNAPFEIFYEKDETIQAGFQIEISKTDDNISPDTFTLQVTAI